MLRSLVVALLMVSTAAQANQAQELLRATVVHVGGSGSGALVKAKSGKVFVLTNWHVCVAAGFEREILMSYPDGRSFRGSVVGSSATKDLCVLTAPQGVPSLAVSPDYRYGAAKVYTRGFPDGVLGESEGRALRPLVWAHTFPIEFVGECPKGSRHARSPSGRLLGCEIQYLAVLLSLHSRPGASGSPVVDEAGKLVMVIASYHPNEGAGAVSYEDVREFLGNF